MKKLLVLISAFVSLTAFAVETKNCPEKLNITIDVDYFYSKSAVYSYASSLDFADYDTIDFFLETRPSQFSYELKLYSKYYSKCFYKDVVFGDFVTGSIIGTHADPRLSLRVLKRGSKLNFNGYTAPTEKEPFYGFEGSKISLSASGYVRNYDINEARYIRVASGKITQE